MFAAAKSKAKQIFFVFLRDSHILWISYAQLNPKRAK